MCRLYGIRSNELTKVECSLVHAQNALLVQSRQDQQGRSNADGWGIACYGAPDPDSRNLPELVRHKTAAYDGGHFSHTAESTFAETVVAHVRYASVGYVGTMNAHPFVHDEWTFAHNGTLPEFKQIEAQLLEETGKLQDSRCGNTDSEQLFLWLLQRLKMGGVDLANPSPERVAELLVESTAELAARIGEVSEQPAKMTYVLTNGPLMFACRFNKPLYQLVRKGVHDCEICGIPHVRHDDSVIYRAVCFASEPVTSEEWTEVPNFTLCTVNDDETLTVKMQEIAPVANGNATA